METLLKNNIIKHINLSLIDKNTEILENIYNKIKPIYNSINTKSIKINHITDKHQFIISQITNSMFNKYEHFKKYTNKIIHITELIYENISFYLTDNINLISAIEMLKISITFAKYNNITKNIIIIWCPIDSKRDFNFNKINEDTLNKSINNFNAFSASGLTTHKNITIVTRYEEAEKLLLHELIHNYKIDGSNYHDNLKHIITKYEKIKNNKHYKYDYCLYESYTELMSSYFSMIFRNINSVDISKRIKIEIIVEILYSYNTICNIIKLNGYSNLNEFIKNGYFKGDICFYEYYYLKALMYNNFIIKFGNNMSDFDNIYEIIINIKPDKLLFEIFDNSYSQTNYKYLFY